MANFTTQEKQSMFQDFLVSDCSWHRKPMVFSFIKSTITQKRYRELAEHFGAELPVFYTDDVYGADVSLAAGDEALSFDFKEDFDAPQMFLLVHKHGTIIVDTQGFNYARYAVRVI